MSSQYGLCAKCGEPLSMHVGPNAACPGQYEAHTYFLSATTVAALAEVDALTARVAELEAELLDRPIYAPSVNDGISLYWGNVDRTVFTVRGNAAYCYRRHGGANHDHIVNPTPEQIEEGIDWMKSALLQPALTDELARLLAFAEAKAEQHRPHDDAIDALAYAVEAQPRPLAVGDAVTVRVAELQRHYDNYVEHLKDCEWKSKYIEQVEARCEKLEAALRHLSGFVCGGDMTHGDIQEYVRVVAGNALLQPAKEEQCRS